MKNLLTKTLFILLFLSVVIPFDVQANLFTSDGKQFAKIAAAAVVGGAIIGKKTGAAGTAAVVGSAIGAIIADKGIVMGIQVVGEEIVRVEIPDTIERAAIAVGSGVGATMAIIGAAVAVIGTEVTGVLPKLSALAAGAGTGAAIGATAGESIGLLAATSVLAAGAGKETGAAVLIAVRSIGPVAEAFLGTVAVAKMITK